MYRLRLLTALLVLLLPGLLSAQETLRVMHYNLLNYGNNTGGCTSTNNALADKDLFLKTITDDVQPDILTVNEMGDNNVYGNRILANVLNTGGTTSFEKGDFTNNSFSSIVNHLFYDSDKLVLHNQEFVEQDQFNNNLVRIIDIYTLYYKDPNLDQTLDTTYLHVVVAHLKAGDTQNDREQRDLATQALMDHLDTKNLPGNYLICGDFNVKNSSEDGYDNLVSHANLDFRFVDPISTPGSWNNNSGFAAVHTQSTRASGNGCFSGGGMDDRFDFILANQTVMDGDDEITYVPNSYRAVGQDGNRFNGNVISPSNSDVSTAVANALYEMSDHLPVVVDLSLSGWITGDAAVAERQMHVSLNNPVRDQWNVRLHHVNAERVTVQVFSLAGQLVEEVALTPVGDGEWRFRGDANQLPAGAYLLKMSTERGFLVSKRAIKI